MSLSFQPGDSVSPGRSRASGSKNVDGKGVYIPDRMGRLGRGTWMSSRELRDPFGRLPGEEAGAPIPGPDELYKMEFSLSGPVGASSENRTEDVAKVEALLGASGHLDLDATGGTTGYFGARVDQAVRDFQKDAGLSVDGGLNPGGETIRTLGELGPPVGYPQTGGQPPRGPDAGTGSRTARPGETQVAIAPLLALPAGYEALATLGLLGAAGGAIASQAGKPGKGEAPFPGEAADPSSSDAEKMMRGAAALPVLDHRLRQYLQDKVVGKGEGENRSAEVFPPLRETFPAEGPELPGHTETPAGEERESETEIFPAHSGDRPNHTETPVPESTNPGIETFPDQSGEFEDFDTQAYKPLRPPNDLGAGDRPDEITRDALARLPSNLRKPVEEWMLNSGIQDEAERKGTDIKGDRPKAEGKWAFERIVRAWGKDPDTIKPESDGRLQHRDPKTGHMVVWREFSSRGDPTLEIHIRRPGEKVFHLKKRFNLD